jgi:hypothetical protein
MLTLMGTKMASRVAASLLRCVCDMIDWLGWVAAVSVCYGGGLGGGEAVYKVKYKPTRPVAAESPFLAPAHHPTTHAHPNPPP